MAQQDIALSSLPAKAAAAITANDQVMLFNGTETTQTPFNEAVAQANALNECYCVKTASLNISSAQILALNTTPVYFGITCPAGYYPRPLSADFWMTFNTTPYATNTEIYIRVGTTSSPINISNTLLAANSDTSTQITFQDNAANVEKFVDGTDIQVSTDFNNPTAGDSDITLVLTYILLPTP